MIIDWFFFFFTVCHPSLVYLKPKHMLNCRSNSFLANLYRIKCYFENINVYFHELCYYLTHTWGKYFHIFQMCIYASVNVTNPNSKAKNIILWILNLIFHIVIWFYCYIYIQFIKISINYNFSVRSFTQLNF